MIETIVRDYLIGELSVPVYIAVPADPGESYVEIERTGGGMENLIRNATVAVKSYGLSAYDAASLHEDVIEHMLAMNSLDNVSSVALDSEYNYTDTATKMHRYQAVFDIVYY